MRFMAMVKTSESYGPPPKALMEAMGKAVSETMKAGTLVETGGLAGTASSSRVRVAGGKLTVLDGPFTETKEVVGGYAILEVKSGEEAKESARWIMQLHLDHWPGWEGECEVRQIMDGPDMPPR
jgi:hypothetical protein